MLKQSYKYYILAIAVILHLFTGIIAQELETHKAPVKHSKLHIAK